MQTHLSTEFAGSADGEEARDIIRKCVHCGFCNATCPTYQLLGDELDGPRGRIYLIKQVLEGGDPTRSTQQHLDRCLTCLNCQTTCPSGVEYGHLVDIGRKIVDARVNRPPKQRTVRWLLKEGLTSPLFSSAMRVGRAMRPLLPAALKSKVPPGPVAPAPEPRTSEHARKVLMLQGCVQPSMMPNIDRSAQRVLDRAGIQSVYARGTGCCGAVRTHLGDPNGGLDDMRRNIDAWMPWISRGDVQAIVSSASACSLAIKEYGHALAGDVDYAPKAARISALGRDLSELLPSLVPSLEGQLRPDGLGRLAFHPPCTLQHGQHLTGVVEMNLRALGLTIDAAAGESHLCCGSAGTYSILQPVIATQLRDRKLEFLARLSPQTIISANIGCIQHLQSGTLTPVKHWIEVLDEALLPKHGE
ncbi:MAG TPA: glycolate oxidase subunit GlcF [Steroidobacteraceae bacterium]|nr:glycolate oxidase subunit GlcF [Steroidobacteraceae bacterium]